MLVPDWWGLTKLAGLGDFSLLPKQRFSVVMAMARHHAVRGKVQGEACVRMSAQRIP